MKGRLEMNTMSNIKSTNEDNLHFIIMTAIEGFVLVVNFLGMLFMALQIKSNMVIWQIVPSLLIMIQVPLLPFLLGFLLYSLGFLFLHRRMALQASCVTKRRLIKTQVFYVLYFIVMFTYWGVSAMSLPQPK